jgi:hypothetical protein
LQNGQSGQPPSERPEGESNESRAEPAPKPPAAAPVSPAPSLSEGTPVASEKPGEAPSGQEAPSEQGGAIMSNLPRTRPQRRSQRRPAAPERKPTSASRSDPAGRAPSARKRPAAQKPASAGGSPSAAPKSAAASAGRPRSARAARGTTPRARPGTSSGRPGAAARQAQSRLRAPGLPELGVSAAVGAAKIPLRVAAAILEKSASLIGRRGSR